jgi:DnaJ-class molecular chaperone
MKDYYKILGVPENCTEADIKKAFRKLAFEHHPDKNPGSEKQAEAKFKEINEAFGVLGDKTKRQQYDLARKSPFAGIGQPGTTQGFGYSQNDIFNGIFSNRAMYEEMNRMFSRAGLRFDENFLNNIFFSGRGMGFRVYTSPGSSTASSRGYSRQQARKPGWLERTAGKLLVRFTNYLFRKLADVPTNTIHGQSLDHHADINVTSEEARAGAEKPFIVNRNGQSKNLLVKIPSGIKAGKKIRLKGMGKVVGNTAGDLYLHVKITG